MQGEEISQDELERQQQIEGEEIQGLIDRGEIREDELSDVKCQDAPFVDRDLNLKELPVYWRKLSEQDLIHEGFRPHTRPYPDQKRPLLLFSGGLDSTYMLYYQLQMVGDADIMYAEGGQGKLKGDAERYARHRILKLMEKKTPFRVVQDCSVEQIHPEGSTVKGSLAIPSAMTRQVPAWFLAALYAFDSTRHSAVQIGYTRGDSFNDKLHDLKLAWHHLSNAFLRTTVPLEFPLLGTDKQRMLQQLPTQLVDNVWVCELPRLHNGEPVACHQCLPCRRMKLEQEIHHKGFGEYEGNEAERAYVRGFSSVEAMYEAARKELDQERLVPQ